MRSYPSERGSGAIDGKIDDGLHFAFDVINWRGKLRLTPLVMHGAAI